jgi:CRP/FNR family transcriptional regulator, nitrogen oxide reductase regulator
MVTHLQSRLLDGLDAQDRATILEAGKEQQFAANSVIVNQAGRANELFLLLHGRARHFFLTEGGQKILLRWLVPGDITGGASLLSKPWRYQLSTEVLIESRLLVWDRDTLQQLMTRFPLLLSNALFIAENYLDWYLTSHITLTCHTARQRCSWVLRSITREIGKKVTGGIEVDITNEELAGAAAITVFEASRFMSEWQRSGAIVKTRGKILVRDLDFLRLTGPTDERVS